MVGDAVQSALDQTLSGIEIIVVDDGSLDDSVQRLEGFSDAIRLLRTDGRGVAAARNLALAHARGTYVAFLDSDDRWRPEKLASQLRWMEQRPELALTFTDYTVSERAGATSWRVTAVRRHEGELTLRRLLERNFIGTLTVMARRTVLVALGGFDETLERGSDYHMWLRLVRRHPIDRVPKVLADYRWHQDSLTGASLRQNRLNHHDVIDRLKRTDAALFRDSAVDPEALLQRSRLRAESA